MAMTGGRIGHVANAVRDDPGMEDIKNIIVVAGQNNIKQIMAMNTVWIKGSRNYCKLEKVHQKK